MTNKNNPLGYCEKCIFWDGQVNEESCLPNYGYCHRHPPTPITQTRMRKLPENFDGISKELVEFLIDSKTRVVNLFSRPVTESDDFCGEWRERR